MTPIWLLYGPQDDDGHEPLLGVFTTSEKAGEWLYANIDDAQEWQGKVSEAKYRAFNKPYPQPFGTHCWWYSPVHRALRGWLDGDLWGTE